MINEYVYFEITMVLSDCLGCFETTSNAGTFAVILVYLAIFIYFMCLLNM